MPEYTIPEGSAAITPNAMFEELRTIGSKVDHLATVVDPALQQVRADVQKLQGELAIGVSECLNDTKAMDIRVRALEHWRWFVLGIAAVVGPAAGIIAYVFF